MWLIINWRKLELYDASKIFFFLHELRNKETVKQTALNKYGYSHKNTFYKCLVNISSQISLL